MASGRKSQDGRVVVYIDGCCLNNDDKDKPRRGGIGVYFGPNDKLNYSGPVEGRPTNNVAEIQAATKAVELCKRKAAELGKSAGSIKFLIKTDSENVSKAMNKWMTKWLNNNWSNVINEEHYKKLLEVSEGMDVAYEHVAGHSKISSADKIGNDAAHNLANKGAESVPVYYD